jgi:hypothetical protein
MPGIMYISRKRIIAHINASNRRIKMIALKFLVTVSSLSRFSEMNFVPESPNPKVLIKIQYCAMTSTKEYLPKLSGPITLTRYGKLIRGNKKLIPLRTEREKKLSPSWGFDIIKLRTRFTTIFFII